MATTTLATIRTAVRRYLDETTADRWTEAELTAYINEAGRWLQSEYSRVNPDIFLRISTATASAGSDQLATPSDLWGQRIRNITCYHNSTVATGANSYRVPPGPLDWILTNLEASGYPRQYALLAGYIRFAPLLDLASCFRYTYEKKETALAAEDSTFDRLLDEHVDVIALYAAIIALQKIGFDTTQKEALLGKKMMQVSEDLQPTDPLTIPQMSID